MNKTQPSLTDDLLQALRKETYVAVATVDQETNAPYVSAISWVYATDKDTVCFSVDNSSKTVANLRRNKALAITVIESGTTFAISGQGVILKEKIEGIPIDLALIECAIDEVRDIMFYGGKMINEPGFEKIYDKEAAAKLDNQVMKALKEA